MTVRNIPNSAELAEQFPSAAQWYYLNHASVSPWPLVARQAVEAFALENHTMGPADYPAWLRNEKALHERYARMVGGNGNDVSLVSNTTEGINLVARGLDWRPGDNLVTVHGEFPTNRLPWAALEDFGVSLRVVDIRAEENPEQALLANMDERTRVLALSSVQWSDGFRLQLETLGQACRAAGVLFFVDAIQHLGALRINVESSCIDCLAAGAHKWQMGPEGLGLLYCTEAWRNRLEPLQLGWRMYDNPFAFQEPHRPISNSGKRFEPGTPNTLGQMALNASLGLQERYGLSWIETRVLSNRRLLAEGLMDIPGIRVVSDLSPERSSGIISFEVPGLDARKLVSALKEHNVIAIPRGHWIRLSSHFYQEKGLLNQVLEHIEHTIKHIN